MHTQCPHYSTRGVSPIIGVIILIAVTVAASVALSGWVFVLSREYMESGGVNILPSESSCSLKAGCTIVVANTGDSQVSVISVWVNGHKLDAYSVTPTTQLGANTIPAHTQANVTFSLQSVSGLYPEQSIEVQLGLNSGNTVSTELTLSY